MDFNSLSPGGRLIAERAVLFSRALEKAADDAPHRQGLACVEKVIVEEGWPLLRTALASVLSARREAQKRGAACGSASAQARRSSRRQSVVRS